MSHKSHACQIQQHYSFFIFNHIPAQAARLIAGNNISTQDIWQKKKYKYPCEDFCSHASNIFKKTGHRQKMTVRNTSLMKPIRAIKPLKP